MTSEHVNTWLSGTHIDLLTTCMGSIHCLHPAILCLKPCPMPHFMMRVKHFAFRGLKISVARPKPIYSSHSLADGHKLIGITKETRAHEADLHFQEPDLHFLFISLNERAWLPGVPLNGQIGVASVLMTTLQAAKTSGGWSAMANPLCRWASLR